MSSIDSLPPHHKSVFNLYFIENHSHAEIANLLGITINTSKSHLLRAKKAVQNYLLNNVIHKNTQKKKMAQLFVIFGLGGLLWAQTFQSKFSDFSILPNKSFEIPENLKINKASFSSSNQAWKKKIIVGSTFLVIIAMSIFLLSPQHSFFNTNDCKTSSDYIDNNQNKTSENLNLEYEQKSDLKSKNSLSNQTLAQSDNKIIASKNIEITEAKSLEKKKNTHKIILKDSIAEVPEKIIIIKKIVKRDTVFIER